MTGQIAGLAARARALLPEVLKFGIIGGLGTIIDLGGAAVLHGRLHVEPLAAKAASVTAATVFTYLGSRFWTFRHRERQAVHREAVLFFTLNLVGLLIAEAVLGLFTYMLALRSALDYNVASVMGTGLGTIFRFYAYRKWVFLAPAGPAPARPAVPARPAGYPHWELDRAYLAAAVPAAVPAVAKAPAYTFPWQATGRHRKAS